jgi:hypothetical protein
MSLGARVFATSFVHLDSKSARHFKHPPPFVLLARCSLLLLPLQIEGAVNC